ncbi:hypothetical protein BRDID11004_47960 [Bradyrhizobium diazoefficiens]|uniref:Uncharacterized protein n=1 Tax=Bradyrhizobium diazoefficiens TaxID=1355477 RepID=A0A809ZVF1_9BRAD|nr:hypothetical protein [Bradyrhizobium diazoefficiens]BBZ94301.1 hypothetical protein F07S3_41340 [Bradyrhizobium diazoefficiens]BCE56389.1 hypothetical protein XF5B_39010 [Bradyrhizobium diazoefficiens]
MADITRINGEIEHARRLVARSRQNIHALNRADVATADAELVLSRQLAHLETLIGERNRLQQAETTPTRRRVLGGRSW